MAETGQAGAVLPEPNLIVLMQQAELAYQEGLDAVQRCQIGMDDWDIVARCFGQLHGMMIALAVMPGDAAAPPLMRITKMAEHLARSIGPRRVHTLYRGRVR